MPRRTAPNAAWQAWKERMLLRQAAGAGPVKMWSALSMVWLDRIQAPSLLTDASTVMELWLLIIRPLMWRG